MKNKFKVWKDLRKIGKGRYIFLIGGFWSGWFIIFMHFFGLWPKGKFVWFYDFLFLTIISIIGGMFSAMVMWQISEKAYLEYSKNINDKNSEKNRTNG